MSDKTYFSKRTNSNPIIYAYRELDNRYDGYLKIGYTDRPIEVRMKEHYPTKRPDGLIQYEVMGQWSAMLDDGSHFMDHDVHRVLDNKKVEYLGGEWYKCSVDDVKSAVIACQLGIKNFENRTQDFKMRPEQIDAVEKTSEYFDKMANDDPNKIPKFLWNCKMRFGKTFSAYQLAKKMDFSKVLILTFKPAVLAAWEEDLNSHIDFEGWQFVSRNNMKYEDADKNRPIVCFGSFQDYLGTNDVGGIKARNEWVHTTNWDLVIFDEYHFGAWRDNAKKLFDSEDEEESVEFDMQDYQEKEAGNAYNESFLPITTKHYLFLSGTPFRALNSGEFIEEQIFNWTYSDEQYAKLTWDDNNGPNPYLALPRMVMLAYKLDPEIEQIAKGGEYNEFDLNIFFSAKGNKSNAEFKYKNEVQKWLDYIRGQYRATTYNELKQGNKKPPMPYSDVYLKEALNHTLWFLPSVASCHAMANLLKEKQNVFYHDYKINVCAGTNAGVGASALDPVIKSMQDPLHSKTITLSCGKLTTGVTVKPWGGIMMLRNLKSPETYFQAAFRVQSPWTIKKDDGTTEIIKHDCYVFDFAINRALRQISEYSCKLNVDEDNPQQKVADFIKFLPVLAYDGNSMKSIDAQEILDFTMAGTTSTLLARRWESALLVNVDNNTLAKLMENEKALNALMNIEGFRTLNKDVETIINKSNAVKKARAEGTENLTPKEAKELSAEEKEFKSKRKEIQDKLIKFATRIPVFMYLTDFREYCLKDVIKQFEPYLFKKVTGLNVEDFNLLIELNVFNGPIMNDAIFHFKRYEDSSLNYLGINKHGNEAVGGWDTVVSQEDYNQLYNKQQKIMFDEKVYQDDIQVDSFTNVVSESQEFDYLSIPHTNVDSPTVVAEVETSTSRKKDNLKDMKKVKLGSNLMHSNFGEGTVIETDGAYIVVKFASGTKKFDKVHAFKNGFLTYINKI